MKKEIQIACKGAGVVSIALMQPFQGELKTIDKESLDSIKKEILVDGFSFPIHLWEDRDSGNLYIIDGHQRHKALLSLKEDGYNIPQIPVVMVGADSYSQAKHKLLAGASVYGKINHQGVLDFLSDVEVSYADIAETTRLDLDMNEFKVDYLDQEKIERIINVAGHSRNLSNNEDDEIPDVVEPIAKLGQIYQLGDHRLMCGDSTNKDYVAELMNGEKANMVFTDPPYGVSYEGGHNAKKRTGIKGDTLEGENLTDLFKDSLTQACDFSEDTAAFYIWYASSKAVETFASFSGLPLKVRAVICWYKVKSGLGAFMSQYIPNYEPCIYAHKEGCAPQWHGPTDEKTVWELKKEQKNEFHPTQKPVELSERAIKNSSKASDIVLDLFGGSGSTLIACEKTNRKCFMMELDPHYVDVIIARWEKFTGKSAALVEPEKTILKKHQPENADV